MTSFASAVPRYSDPGALLADFADLTIRHTAMPVSLCDHSAMRDFVLRRMGQQLGDDAKTAVFKGTNKVLLVPGNFCVH